MTDINYTVKYRRRRQFKTDYKKRIKLLASKKPRLVIRTTLNNIYAQIIRYNVKGDEILASANSKELEKLDWKFGKNNIPAAYLVGMLIARKALKQKLNEVVIDTGLVCPVRGSKLYSCIKGAVDGGLKIKCENEKFPSEERISGKHISDYSAKAPNKFSKTQNTGKITETFNQIKNKIMAM